MNEKSSNVWRIVTEKAILFSSLMPQRAGPEPLGCNYREASNFCLMEKAASEFSFGLQRKA